MQLAKSIVKLLRCPPYCNYNPRLGPPVVGTSQDPPKAVALDLIPNRATYWRVLHTSVSEADDGTVVPHDNGFVCTVLRAWQQDQHLELRPDDV